MLRRLASGERDLAAEVFGAGLDAHRVRLLSLPGWNRAFVAGGRLVVWPARTVRPDFGAPDVPATLQAVFVHELTHVWQAQNGTFLPWAKIRAGDGPATYAYDLEAGVPFADLNIEQQAMVVEHTFLARRGFTAPYAWAAYEHPGEPWRRA